MRFWKNSVKKVKLSHMCASSDYYFVNPQTSTTYLLRKGLAKEYYFEVCPKNDDIFDEWETTQENIDILLAKIDEFKKELENAKAEQDGFIAVRFSKNSVLYYKHIEKALYQFILVDDEFHERMYNCKTTPTQFLSKFCPLILSYTREKSEEEYDEDDETKEVRVSEADKKLFASEHSPFYLSAKEHDKYLAAEMDYFCGNVSEEVVETLNTVRQKPVFFAEKKVYDIDDIEKIQDIERGKMSFFNRAAYYYLKVQIKDRLHKAEWWPTEKELRINCYEKRIKISDALHKRIEFLTGETNEQRKTRERLQLENYLYGYKDGLSRLPIEKRNEIFEKMGQVSLEDLKALPKHHLKKLSVAHLYDWLHCSGNTGNPEAVAFIEHLAKTRKENDKY